MNSVIATILAPLAEHYDDPTTVEVRMTRPQLETLASRVGRTVPLAEEPAFGFQGDWGNGEFPQSLMDLLREVR